MIGCKIHHNGANGCEGGYRGKGTISLQNCEIHNNGANGIRLYNGSEATVVACNIHHNQHDGIFLNASTLNVGKSLILQNSRSGIWGEGNDTITATQNKIVGNGDCGIGMQNGTQGVFTQNILQNNSNWNISNSNVRRVNNKPNQ